MNDNKSKLYILPPNLKQQRQKTSFKSNSISKLSILYACYIVGTSIGGWKIFTRNGEKPGRGGGGGGLHFKMGGWGIFKVSDMRGANPPIL